MLFKCRRTQLILITAWGAFTVDLEMTRRENPKLSNSVTVAMASASTHDLDVVFSYVQPTDFTHFLLRKHLETLTTGGLLSFNAICRHRDS